MIKVDKPIKTIKEDELGTSKFAVNLGKALNTWNDKDSIVIGLYGKWGSGKSSVINMAMEHIQKDAKKQTIIVNFNPWNFSEQQQLITIFFNELAKAINHYDKGEDAKKVGEQLITYSKFFTTLGLVPGLSPYTTVIEKVLAQVGETSIDWGELKTKDLSQYRKELDTTIKKLNKKIIVIIDDIDRLNKVEIKQMFKLVKQVADFPNTIYLLAFDQEKTLNIIDEKQEFLEKIIQVNFHVPTPQHTKLEKFLFVELDNILKPFDDNLWDKERWADLYRGGYDSFFTSLRKIKQYVNSLAFNININSDEINPLDFFIVEALRVFYPTLYENLAQSKQLLVGQYFLDNDRDKEQRRTQFEKLLGNIADMDKQKVRILLLELFPQMAALYNNISYDDEAKWFKDKRICAEKRFGNYFHMDVDESVLSQKEINKIISLANSKTKLKKKLKSLIRKNEIRALITRVSDITTKIDSNHIRTFIVSLYDISDGISRERKGDFDFGVQREIAVLTYKLLELIPEKEREAFIIEVIKDTTSISAPSYFITRLENEIKENTKEAWINQEMINTLSIQMVNKIQDAIKEGNLYKSQDLAWILYAWKRWDKDEDVNQYVHNMIYKSSSLLALLKAFCGRSYSGYEVNKMFGFDDLKNFVEIEKVYEAMEKIKSKKVSKENKVYIDNFFLGYEKWEKGETHYF